MAEEKLESVVGELMRSQGLTLAVAESCTGGLLGHRLTNVPGSSDYFIGGVVAYSYDAKERVLGVRHNTLYDHGAVSEKTALEMARSARRLFATDVALSVTGIAGPGGGMPGKPVGLVYVALSTRDQEVCHRFVWESNREGNKAYSAQAALEILLAYLRERGWTMDNTWFGDEEVAVEAQFLADGEIRPTAFTWRGSHRRIAGLGRQWDETDGRHVLVEATDGSRFELCLTSPDNKWRLQRAWERPDLA
jgi:PncC family amidohydrolase